MKRAKMQSRFVRGASGAVSIYMIAATAAFLLLCALLIDLSRIAAFRHAAMLAVQSGVRSVMSAYDANFYARYGLFIRGGEEGNALLRSALEGHFAHRPGNGVFPYLDAEWTDAGLTESRPLADHAVFHRQVMEEMKYKAPIDVTLELAERFRGVTTVLQEAADTVDLLERMRDVYDRREGALDRMLGVQEQAGRQTVSALQHLVPYPSGGSGTGGADHLVSAAQSYAGYRSMKQALSQVHGQTDPRAIMQLVSAIHSYESGIRRLSSALSEASVRMEAEASAIRSRAMDALRQAQTANEEMKRLAAEADGPGKTEPAEPGTAQSEPLADIRRSVSQLIREDRFFQSSFMELQEQADRTNDLSREAAQAAALLASVPGSGDLEAALHAAAARLRERIAQFASAYGDNGSRIRGQSQAIQAHRARDGERKALEKEAEAEWNGWKELSGALSGGREDPDARQAFQEADRLFRDNLAWNRQQDEQTPGGQGGGSPSDNRLSAMKLADGWMDGLLDAAAGARDSFYFSEYVLARFAHADPSEVQRMREGKTPALPLEKQEAEYILYGWADPKGNIAAAYGEIFALRLAVRSMEGLIESRGMGHPLVILASSLVYGVRHAVQDMHQLLDKQTIPLSKYAKAETVYTDYLRLFFLLHGGTPSRLSRAIAVIGHETELDLTEAYTYAAAEGTASLRLWFIPGLVKWLGHAGQLGGTVKGNRYEAVYAAESSYL